MATFSPILFDLDGTLVDSSADIAAAVNRTLSGLDLPTLPRAEIVSFVGDGVRRLMVRTFDRLGVRGVDEAVARFKRDYRARCLEATRPYPGLPALLAALDPTPKAVVTNKPVAFARQILAGLGLQAHFGAVVGGDEALLKPDPAPVRLAIERLGQAEAQAAGRGLMVGDHANDVAAGRAAGLATCGVLWGFDQGAAVRPSRPDHLVATPRELAQLLGI